MSVRVLARVLTPRTGFKSAFKVADQVYVLSQEYTFYFDKNRELGMITPIWTTQYPVRHGWTTFRLRLSYDAMSRIPSQFDHFDPALLLFLRKLRHIELRTGSEPIALHRIDHEGDIMLRSVQGSAETQQRYLVVRHPVTTPTQEPKRSGVSETYLTLAFPMTMDEEPVIEDQAVYAFLPLRRYGFRVSVIRIYDDFH